MAGFLEDKVALVTGAGSGIGRSTALAFAKEGAKVVVADIAVPDGEKTVRMIGDAGGEATFVKVDISKASEVEDMVNTAVQSYGRLDCAHNNAGIEGPAIATADVTEEDWDRVMDINLKGAWLCTKYEVKQMLAQGGGAIVNTASGLGVVGLPSIAAYTASKHGVVGLTQAAALDYATQGIRVNAVMPGVTRTPMMDRQMSGAHLEEDVYVRLHPIGRLGQPEEIAEAVIWLCSDRASFVTGHAMAVDGGYLTW